MNSPLREEISDALKRQSYPREGTVDITQLPPNVVIIAGQEVSGLELLQHPRLMKFMNENKERFIFPWNRDVAIYQGPDAEIP